MALAIKKFIHAILIIALITAIYIFGYKLWERSEQHKEAEQINSRQNIESTTELPVDTNTPAGDADITINPTTLGCTN